MKLEIIHEAKANDWARGASTGDLKVLASGGEFVSGASVEDFTLVRADGKKEWEVIAKIAIISDSAGFPSEFVFSL